MSDRTSARMMNHPGAFASVIFQPGSEDYICPEELSPDAAGILLE